MIIGWLTNAYLENVEVSLTFLLCLVIDINGDDEGDAVVDWANVGSTNGSAKSKCPKHVLHY